MKKVDIGQKSKVVVKWNVLPIDYSRDSEESIKIKFSKKYSISKDNVKVEPVFIQLKSDGTTEPIVNDTTRNIQDKGFQQELFKKYLKERSIEGYDFDKLIEIDESINNSINYELYDSNKKYSIKWVKWSNFMSYGKDNYFDFTALKGLVLLTSEPANQGGKSTFCLDLLRFLLFGKVTSRESDWTLSKAFNKHLEDETEVTVEGCVVIDGCEYIIKRTITRPSSKNRTSKSKVTHKVTYYKVINSDEILELSDNESQDGCSTTETNKVIKNAIGNERDFDLMICVNSDNLKDLISLKDTERGRLITRWIGLLPLEEKDKIARETYNKNVLPSLLMNRYNSTELSEQIGNMNTENEECLTMIAKIEANEKNTEKKITEYNTTKETLLSSKTKIDESLTKVDVKTVENRLNMITEEGKRKKAEKEENTKKLNAVTCLEFDEKVYKKIEEDYSKTFADIAVVRQQCKQVSKEIELLEKSEFCPTCGAKLKNVDNSKAIEEKKKEYEELVELGIKLKKMLDEYSVKKDEMTKMREEYNNGIRLKLVIEKNDVDIENLKISYRENRRILKDVEDNKNAIENNNKIDTSLNIVNENIKSETEYLNSLRNKKNELQNIINGNNKTIIQYNEIIKTLENEAVLVKNWKIYLDMIGKNGISKLVLRNTLPLINGELNRILNGVCDFTVEVVIDDRNDVAFNLIHDNVVSNLASGSGFEQTVASLALRSVLSKISTFSKPSFVIFDEVLGGVSDENYEQVKNLYDKIVKDYDFIFQITHLKQISDWHDKTVVVRKVKNISTISMA